MTGTSQWFMGANNLHHSIQNQTIVEQLEESLQKQQQKYNYHKKISQGYYEIMQQTELKLQEIRNVRYNAG